MISSAANPTTIFNSRIKYELEADVVSPLKPGELGYSYSSGSLYIGPKSSVNENDVITLITAQNNVINYIIQSVVVDVRDKVPSSNAIYLALKEKASLDEANIFNSSNYFPDVEIDNTPDSQGKLVVNVRSLKRHTSKLRDNIIEKLSAHAHMAYSERYEFLTPLETWNIHHQYNTDSINIVIRQLGTNRILMAPYDIIDDSFISIYFASPTSGYVDIEFT
jgi:hypothetical protein